MISVINENIVILAVTVGSVMLPPMVILKRKLDLKLDVPSVWIVTVQEKEWLDTLILKWIKDIYIKYRKKDPSLIVLDSFRGHLRESIKKAFRQRENCNGGNTRRMNIRSSAIGCYHK